MKPPRRRLLVLLGVLALVLALAWRGDFGHRGRSQSSGTAATAKLATEEQIQAYLALAARETAADQSVWTAELNAERHEDVFVRLWDALNSANDPWTALIGLPFATLVTPRWSAAETLPHEIRRWRGQPAREALDPGQWGEFISKWRAAGWTLGRTTWHLPRHTPAQGVEPARSTVVFTAQLANAGLVSRAVLNGELVVAWTADTNGGTPLPGQIILARAELLRRDGPVPFTPWLDEELPPGTPDFPDPLFAADLDGDGRSELLLVGANRVWRNRPTDAGDPHRPRRFVSETLAKLPPNRLVAAAWADVNGDGRADLVFADPQGLHWIAGDPGGRLGGDPQIGWPASPALKHPQVLAVGDVNGDGAPDLWLAQYKLPYQAGQFPTPYYDANDGFPAHLLLNDGHGHFTEATAAAGLAAKRFRRTYSASFLDLNGDGAPDLVNVSDFAGLDIYLNDGHGKFTDVTDALGDGRHAFGMGHVFGDFNGDGRPGLLMLGMDSTVAQRLDALGLGRAERPELNAARGAMAWGNRLFTGAARGPVSVTGPLATALAHTGWTWGAAWADFGNDRRSDLAVANGHETRPSARDYERQFWRHDIYVGGSENNPAAELYYRAAAGARQAEGASYGGWQTGVFRLDCGGGDFPDVAWLFGLAVPADGRNLIADDLDGDGRLDLVMTTFEQWPAKRQRLLVFHNELPTTNHWIGFRLDGGGRSAVGARVELEDTAGRQTRWIVAGDAYRSQTAAAAHFGLGGNRPLRAIIHWPGGRETTLTAPAADRWHAVSPPP